MIFDDEWYCEVYTTTFEVVDTIQQKVEELLYCWPCQNFSSKQSNYSQSELSMSTNTEMREVVFDCEVNDVKKWDNVRLYDINKDLLWYFEIVLVNKYKSISWHTKNTHLLCKFTENGS